MLLPNIYLHEMFGKALFVLADVLIGLLIYMLLRLRSASEGSALKYSWCVALSGWLRLSLTACSVWLFHPFSINVSTRGNADAVIGLLVLWSLYLLLTKRVVLSAIVYGLAVHFKIYPIVYALALLVFLDDNFLGGQTNTISDGSLYSRALHFVNRQRLVFSIVSAGTFLGMTGFFYVR